MKKINANIYKLIAVAVVATGTFSSVATTASAKPNKEVKTAKLIKKIKTKHYSEVRGNHGVIYANYKLKQIVGNLKKHKHTNFKSNTKFIIKMANGKKATYRLIKHKHFKGVVLNQDVKVIKVKQHHAKSTTNSSVTPSSSTAASASAASNSAANSTSATATSSTSSSNVSYITPTTGTTSATTTNSAVSTTTGTTATSSANSSTSSNSSNASNSASSNSSNSATSNNSSAASKGSDTASNSTTSRNNSASNSASPSASSIFTSAEADQIKQYQAEAKSLMANDDTNIYAEQPTVHGTFNSGKLNDAYIQNSVDWINFFRKFNDLQPVTSDSQFNADAQNAAAVLDNIGKVLTHSISNYTKPSYITDDEWNQANDTLGKSNLSQGAIKPYETAAGFISDNHNAYANSSNPDNTVPGHRLWLIGNITKVGIGQSNEYGDYKYDDVDGIINHPVVFPAASLYPVELLNNAYWSVSLPSYIDSNQTPTVTVHDNTANKDVAISFSHMAGIPNGYSGGYGQYRTNFWFMPDQSAIHADHSYTITVNGLPGYSEPYTYTTKLFSLGTPTV